MELRTTPFLCGEQPTLADIAVHTSVEYLHLAGFDVTPFPAIARWADTCTARPGWEPVNLPASLAATGEAL
jgi:glutathione S-transferase